jgi:hypothetical protein
MTGGARQPLAYGQRALWFLQRLAPHSAAYNVILPARLRSPLAAGALVRACAALMARHATLRTLFPAPDGAPVRAVQPAAAPEIELTEAVGWDGDQADEWVAARAHLPFDLERGPLVRLHLLTLGAADHLMLLVIHHIAVDFASLAQLLGELGELYAAERDGGAARLPAATAGYDDYVRWQAELLGGPEGERLWSYWRERLRGVPHLALATDFPRPRAQGFRGAVHGCLLDAGLHGALASLARGERTSLGALLLAALFVVLHEMTGQEDIAVGWPAPGRGRPELDQVVGYFVNPVVVRAQVTPDGSFRQLLARVSGALAEALAHQDYPFPLLVERLQPQRNPGESPLFQVLCVLYEGGQERVSRLLQGVLGEALDVGGLQLEGYPLRRQAAMLDLSLIAAAAGDSLSLGWQYDAALFAAETVAALSSRYVTLLAQLAGRARTADAADAAGVAGLTDVAGVVDGAGVAAVADGARERGGLERRIADLINMGRPRAQAGAAPLAAGRERAAMRRSLTQRRRDSDPALRPEGRPPKENAPG